MSTEAKVGAVVRITHRYEGRGPAKDYAREFEGTVVGIYPAHIRLRRNGQELDAATTTTTYRNWEMEVITPAPQEPGYYLVRPAHDYVTTPPETVVRYWDGENWRLGAGRGRRTNANPDYWHIVERIVQS